MNWNPAPEVAVARDAAKRLGNAPITIVIWITDEDQIGVATYGRTKALCAMAKELGVELFAKLVDSDVVDG